MSKISRLAFIIGMSAVVVAGFLQGASAQSSATQEMTVICSFAAGTGGDQTVRLYAEKMRPLLGRNIIIKNVTDVPGKLEGVAATEYLAHSKPDGNTIYLTPGAIIAANQNLLKNPPVDVAKELLSFGTITQPPIALIVRSDSPYKSLAELTVAMKEKGEKARFGSPNSSMIRVVATLYKQMAGLQATATFYNASADVLKDLTSGAIDFGFSNNVFSVQQERQGRVRILAIDLAKRLQAAPQYATFKEFGYPIDVDGWWAGFVPSATPRPIVNELGRVLSEVVSSADSKKFLNDTISDPWVQTPEQAQAHFIEQLKAWEEYVQIAKLEKR